MGAANIVPGVSGGTVALITGIYEKLINSIKSFGIDSIRLILSGRLSVKKSAPFSINVSQIHEPNQPVEPVINPSLSRYQSNIFLPN